jgi:hypothetical protein
MNKKYILINEQMDNIRKELNLASENIITKLYNNLEPLNNYKAPEKNGIYYFEIDLRNVPLDNFMLVWDGEGNHFPKFNQKRAKNVNQTQNWLPLYIGTNQNLDYRINEHINKYGGSTSALRLKERGMINRFGFKISSCPTEDIINPDNYNYLSKILEEIIFEKINPIVGRKN